MSCPASGKIYPLSSLVCVSKPETIPGRVVNAGNKLSVAKFECPECKKSVDVFYLADGTVKIGRYHTRPGETTSVFEGAEPGPVRRGRKPNVAPVSLTGMAEMRKRQEEARNREMTDLVRAAELTVKTADASVQSYLDSIKAFEAKIESIKADKALAESILADQANAQFLSPQAEPTSTANEPTGEAASQ